MSSFIIVILHEFIVGIIVDLGIVTFYGIIDNDFKRVNVAAFNIWRQIYNKL
jgi:hypothetical protein